MLRLTFHRKIALSILLTALIISFLYTSINLAREQSVMQETLIKEKTELSEFLAITVEVAEARVGLAYKYKLIEEIQEHENVLYVRLVKPTGEIYLSTEKTEMGKSIRDSAMRTNKTIVKDDIFHGETIKVAVSPASDGHTVWLGFSLKELEHGCYDAIQVNLLILLPVCVIILITSFYLSRNMIEPIRLLISGVESIRKGDMDYRISVKGEDEIGQLASAFNQMTFDLKKSREELEGYSRDLEKKVSERTEELNAKVDELERFNRLMVDRELKMKELKDRIRELEVELKST